MTNEPAPTSQPRQQPEQPPAGGAWGFVRGAAIFLIVAWHLVYFAIRNPLDLWEEGIKPWLKQKSWWEASEVAIQPGKAREVSGKWEQWGEAYEFADKATKHFGRITGSEQGWVMFSPPMAKRSAFLGVRFEFEDGGKVTVPSETHPDPARFFRFGGWQTRKYEDYLMDKYGGPRDYDYPMWRAFVRKKVGLWRERYRHQYEDYEDEEPARVVLVKRYVRFPRPDAAPGDYPAPEDEDVASFRPDGEPAK